MRVSMTHWGRVPGWKRDHPTTNFRENLGRYELVNSKALEVTSVNFKTKKQSVDEQQNPGF